MKRLQILIILLVFFITGCSGEKIEPNISGDVPDFNFTTQDNKQMKQVDLEGEWWITYFMYTNCTQVCPTTTPNMVSLQDSLQELEIDVQIISFTVDPEYDTPKILSEYAEEYQADLSNWTFLTGYDFEDIKDVSKKSFETQLSEGSPGEVQFSHSTNFFLVDPEGNPVKKYDGMGTEELNILIEDLKKVL